MTNPIEVSVEIDQTIDKVWNNFSQAAHITKWYFASPDWHCPSAEIEENGKFNIRMEAKDQSFGFNFSGRMSVIKELKQTNWLLEDGRSVTNVFKTENGKTRLVQTFEPESENPVDMQKMGWQSILDNFKKYCEKK